MVVGCKGCFKKNICTLISFKRLILRFSMYAKNCLSKITSQNKELQQRERKEKKMIVRKSCEKNGNMRKWNPPMCRILL